MNCPQCGEICRCSSREGESQADAVVPPPAGNAAWRGEISARLSRYRARRKIRPPRYPSLRLQFARVEARALEDRPSPNAPPRDPVSLHALALDGAEPVPPPLMTGTEVDSPLTAAMLDRPLVQAGSSHSGAKIIEFPRFAWGPPEPPSDQLAEPVIERPRILEVPEVAPALPALGGITMEAVQVAEAEKRPGIDIPLQSASLARRFCASLIDGLIVIVASALFGATFWKVTMFRPPLAQIVGLTIGIPCLLWGVYQYLLIVYAGRTPGLLAAGLRLARFDGSAARRSLRRWRVLASYLSAASLGMGYAWVFLDEDTLCWHDRITRTYLAPKNASARAAKKNQLR
jgi:uncharacterized RDD family membrane protein YckC